MAALILRCGSQGLTKTHCASRVLEPHKQISATRIFRACLHSRKHLTRQRCVRANQLLCQQHHRVIPLSATAFLRHNSSSSNSTSTLPDSSNFINPPDYIPPAPPVPEPSDVVDTLSALGEPTLQSLGLGNFTPAGLVQQGLELLHVGLNLPWWGSIVIGTIVVRLCMFPIVVKGQKMSMNMMNHMPTVQRLQVKFTQARQRGNMLEAMKYGGELQEYMKRNNVKPFGQMLMPMCQLPVFLSVFIGLRGMANLPVESMKTGGALWFLDLTVAEPFYGLPLMTAFTFWLTVEAGADGLSAQSQTHVLKWVLRGMPVIMLPLISNFPTAMLVYWFTSNSFSLLQVLFLKIPSVRQFFNIPQRVIHPIQPSEHKGFLEGFRESYSNMKASQQVMERQRLDDLNTRKSAHGPIVKTYSYNPKEVNRKDRPKSNTISAKSKS